MATEILIPMGTFKAYALTDMVDGRLVKWSAQAEHITYCDAGDRAVGIVAKAVNASEIVNQYGSVEFFKTAGMVKTTLDFTHAAGTELQSGADGKIEPLTTGYAFGVLMTSGSADTDAEIYIY